MPKAAKYFESAIVVEPFDHEFTNGPVSSASLDWPSSVPSDANKRKKNLDSLLFDCFQFSDDELLLCLFQMFTDLGLVAHFNIPATKLQTFLLRVRKSYREVPFHNFRHAFNVTQSCYAFLCQLKLKESFGELEMLALLVGCVGHDLDHPGFSNALLKVARTRLAVRHNDKSVLENHHCGTLFAILSNDECDILQELTKDQFTEFRTIIIELIFATDLEQHKQHMDTIGKLTREALDEQENQEARSAARCAVIKCADLANEIRPDHSLSKQWAERVMTEFFIQGDLEKERGFPVGFLNDRDTAKTPSGQIGFINFLCKPLYVAVAKVWPTMQTCVDNLEKNAAVWNEISEQS